MLDEQALRTALNEALARIRVLEDALQDAIGAIRHAGHPVASQWLPSLEKKLRPAIVVESVGGQVGPSPGVVRAMAGGDSRARFGDNSPPTGK